MHARSLPLLDPNWSLNGTNNLLPKSGKHAWIVWRDRVIEQQPSDKTNCANNLLPRSISFDITRHLILRFSPLRLYFHVTNKQSRKYLIGRSKKNDKSDWPFDLVMTTPKITHFVLSLKQSIDSLRFSIGKWLICFI